MDIKVSVIMPVYKVEEYLPKAIESMTNQTLKDIEIIIVDDGSPDNCPAIADEYAARDVRIKVIHQKNGGAANARNAGIDIAGGKYLYFLDPDDWAEEDMLETFYNLCEANDARMLIAGFIMEFYENGKAFSIAAVPESCIYDRNEFRKNAHIYLGNTMLAVPWNKLYRTSYIKEKNLRFPEITWDDLHFNMEVIKDVDRVVVCDRTFYHFFRSRAGSETTKVFDSSLYEKRKQQFEHVLEVYEHWNITDSAIMSKVYAYYTSRLVQCVQELSAAKGISRAGKRSRMKVMLTDELTVKSLKNQQQDSTLMAMCTKVLKTGNITLCMLMGKLIGIIKGKNAARFQQLKAKTLKQNG